MHDNDMKSDDIDLIMSVLPLRDIVIFPGSVTRLDVGRPRSVEAVESAVRVDQKIFLVAQKQVDIDDPSKDDLYQVGVVANIVQVLHLPNNRLHVLVEGLSRYKIKEFKPSDDMLRVAITPLKASAFTIPPIEQEELVKILVQNFELYLNIENQSASNIISSLAKLDNFYALVNTIASQVNLSVSESQKLLQESDLEKQMTFLIDILQAKVSNVYVQDDLNIRMKKQIDKSQREYILNEQLKAIQSELSDLTGEQDELDTLEHTILNSGMSAEALEKSKSELKKLRAMSPMSPESSIIRSYLDYMVKLPWDKATASEIDLHHAQSVLDSHHYGLEKVKERILEFLAVSKRTGKVGGTILCLVGPPGVGKTSLAKSIAESLGREYVRFALGGVRDEAEIRGHRKTYIGSMPGKIIQSLIKAKVNNPLFLLDEVDKLSSDYRGDPSSALLEVLDPEQNQFFNDHYMEVDFDLSKVLFIATANSMDIPAPLLDRMEIIRIAGYTETEKQHIANQYLVPNQLKSHSLKKSEINLSKTAIKEIIHSYTREAGVRELNRSVEKICRKVVKQLLLDNPSNKISITQRNVSDYLGVKKYQITKAHKENKIGQVTGMAWTQVGGELLTIEVAAVPGKGDIFTTGQLGNVMQESIKAALTVVRDRSKYLVLPQDFYKNYDIHVHVPEGATPKDGPSAGIAMCIGLLSALTKNPVYGHVAMTGEITLRGEVLPIGGVKEKLLAAHRGGIKTVIIPQGNEKDLHDVPEEVRNQLDIKIVRWIDEVMLFALKQPTQGKSAITHTRNEEFVTTGADIGCHLPN